jgi:hypothetical protein
MIDWSAERIATLSLDDLKRLRVNAIRQGNKSVIALCEAELTRRTPVRAPKVERSKMSRRGQYVGGYHFVCPREKGVTLNGDGTVWTGTWVVEESNAEKSLKYGAYVALHTAKSEASYLQGNIWGWRKAKRDREYADGRPVKIEFGVDFLLTLRDQPYPWNGEGAGEKGYVWQDVAGGTDGQRHVEHGAH